MLTRLVLLALFSLYLNPLSAQDLSQLELNSAAERHLEVSEFMLRKAYQQVEEVVEGERLALLEKSQAEWLEYRDATLELISSRYAGGSIAPLIRAQNAVRMNQDRIAELTAMHLTEITP